MKQLLLFALVWAFTLSCICPTVGFAQNDDAQAKRGKAKSKK